MSRLSVHATALSLMLASTSLSPTPNFRPHRLPPMPPCRPHRQRAPSSSLKG